MVKKNYRAWYVSPKDFSHTWTDKKKLETFARWALLAPSGHNTQPWKLVSQNKSLRLELNREHYLSIDGSGLLSVEPYISLGTFIEVFSLAARGFGYEVDTNLILKDDKIAEITIKKSLAPEPEILKAIAHRTSNREPYLEKPIGKSILERITSPQPKGAGGLTLTKRADISFVATQTKRAIRAIMGNPAYRDELSKWVRANHTRRFDGMPGFTHGFGNIKALASKLAVKHGAKLGPQADKSANLILKSGALVIVYCKNSRTESFIDAGRLYSRICVLARMHGLASSALGAAVLDPSTREVVKKHFGIKHRPVYILRLGKATKPARHSPRWPLEKVLSP